jgi:hypothetical protein
MLLNHARGIADWLTDAAIAEIVANPARIREVDECVDLAAAQEPVLRAQEGLEILEHGLQSAWPG